MTLPRYALARLTRFRYVRFQLDHDAQTARVLNIGPQEVAHSSANGIWVHAHLEPFQEVQQVEDLQNRTLRLMGYPFNEQRVYRIVDRVPQRKAS